MDWKDSGGTPIMCIKTSELETSLGWKARLRSDLPLLGHRNWIAIVDSASALSANDEVETCITHESLISVLNQVLNEITQTPHIRPNVYLDEELKFLSETESPGADAFRKQFQQTLSGLPITSELHSRILITLNDASLSYKVSY